jgi:hypothetical protein
MITAIFQNKRLTYKVSDLHYFRQANVTKHQALNSDHVNNLKSSGSKRNIVMFGIL